MEAPLYKHKTVYALDEDRKKNMHSKSALHAVNEASVRSLRAKVLQRHQKEEQS